MTSTSARPIGSSSLNPGQPAPAGTGHFMLTLCRLAAPVSIRPPQAPQLKSFTFFMSRAPQADGRERYYLHMGYFETLADAEVWVEAVRRLYPDAFATLAPGAIPRAGRSRPALARSNGSAPPPEESLTDTQVLRILETRRLTPAQHDADDSHCDQIALLRPEETGIRQALKEAVVQGAPVSFAVQLHWSAEPIDLSRVPSLAVFKTHTLYARESRRDGRSRYFLRLGFFPDPISAKQVAVQVRSSFAAAAVVPVVEQEVTRAREAGKGTSAIPYLVEPRVDQGTDSGDAPGSPPRPRPSAQAPRHTARGAAPVGPTLQPLAEGEMWTEPDSLSESGVRHLRVEVLENASGRWKRIRLGATPSNTVQIYS